MRDDERHRRSTGFHRGFCGCGRVVRLLHALLRRRPSLYRQRPFAFEALDQSLGGNAVVFIDHHQTNLGRGVAAPAEDHGKDSKERDRQDEAQRQSATVAAQADQCGAHNGENQSRNSLPVKCRNTDSRFGFRSEMSASSCPALVAASSNPAISDACSMVNCAIPLS